MSLKRKLNIKKELTSGEIIDKIIDDFTYQNKDDIDDIYYMLKDYCEEQFLPILNHKNSYTNFINYIISNTMIIDDRIKNQLYIDNESDEIDLSEDDI